MSSKMLKFVSTEKAMPEKRVVKKRVSDFDEIYDDFDKSEPKRRHRVVTVWGSFLSGQLPFAQ